MRTLPADSSQSAGGSTLDINDQPTPRDETPFSISRDTGAPMTDTKTLADATDAMIELGKGEITEDEYHQRIGGEPDEELSGGALVEPAPTNEPPNPEAEHPSPDSPAPDTVEPDGGVATPLPSGEAIDDPNPNIDETVTLDDQTQATSSGGATVASINAAPESVALVEATPLPE